MQYLFYKWQGYMNTHIRKLLVSSSGGRKHIVPTPLFWGCTQTATSVEKQEEAGQCCSCSGLAGRTSLKRSTHRSSLEKGERMLCTSLVHALKRVVSAFYPGDVICLRTLRFKLILSANLGKTTALAGVFLLLSAVVAVCEHPRIRGVWTVPRGFLSLDELPINFLMCVLI